MHKHAGIMLLIIVLLILMPGMARAEEVRLGYDINYGGNYLNQFTWNRVRVAVANNGPQDFQGTVLLDTGAKYSKEVFVEAGKTAGVVFYLPPRQLMESWSTSSGLGISVHNSKGKQVAQEKAPASMWGPDLNYVGVFGKNPGNFNRIANVLPDVQVTGIEPEDLNNLPYAQNLRAIIVSDPGAITLNSVQQDNLQRWVEMGGILILGGGSGWQGTTALVPDALLPMKPLGIEMVSGADLADLKLPVPPADANYAVSVGDYRGSVLMTAGTTPLILRRGLGQGAVLWSSLDLEAAPLDNPANSEALWNQIFMLQPPSQLRRAADSWVINQLFYGISQDSLASALSPGRLLLLLLGYIILIGPVNWLILRKLDRREWAWLTIPVLALLFTTGAFAAGRIGRGTDKTHYQVNLVDVYSDNLAGVRSHGGVFVPRRGKFSITSEAPGFAPLDQAGIAKTEGGLSALEYTNAALWSVQRFYGTDCITLPGSFGVQMSYSGQRIQADVTNNSGHDLFDSYIRMGQSWYAVGAIEAGETVSINQAPSHVDIRAILGRYSNALNFGWIEMDHLVPTGTMVFVGLSEQSLMPVNGTGETVALNLWMQVMDADNLGIKPGPLNISAGVLTPAILTGGGISRWGGEYTFDGQGSCDLEFTLPHNIDYTKGEFTLNLRSLWGEEGTVTVYNYAVGEWQELASLGDIMRSQKNALILENPQDLVRDNRLMVRLNYQNHMAFSLGSLDITIKGGMIND